LTSNQIRFIKVQIANDELVPIKNYPIASSWDVDMEQVPHALDAKEPCYILFRLDEKNAHGYLWTLMCYVPDVSKVRDKMTYASSRSNLRKQLGSTYFADELFGTIAADFTLKGYEAHREMQRSENPLTFEERQQIQEREQGVFIGGASTAYVHGVAFPVESQATQALQDLLAGNSNYVQLAIDADAEKIILAFKKSLDIGQLGGEVPTNDQPRFHFFSDTTTSTKASH